MLCLLGLVSCAAPASIPAEPLPTETIQPSETPTATIVWFPPTATFTPLPSTTPNLDVEIDIQAPFGEVVFQDNYDEPELWTSGKMSAGSIAFGKNELSLGISEAKGYLYSIRQGTLLSDFYLEVTVNPSICRAEDEYGILFRMTSEIDFFRFGLTCRGEARVDRILAGNAASLQPPTLNGSIPPGAPSSSRLAIWANGREMRFYVNGDYLFTVRDSSLLSGGIGVYTRAAGNEAMTVNFSDLVVYEIAP